MLALKTPSLRLHRPSGRAVVTLAGRDHSCGPWGSKQAQREYDRLIGEWRSSGGVVDVGRKRDVTVAELVLAYRKFDDHGDRLPTASISARCGLRVAVAQVRSV